MTRTERLAFLRRHRLCVKASITSYGTPPRSALWVSDDLELAFDTLGTTRKMTNRRRNAHIALVVAPSLLPLLVPFALRCRRTRA